MSTTAQAEQHEPGDERQEHEHAVGRVAEHRQHSGDQGGKRVRRGCAVDAVVGQVTVRELLAPEQRVVAVVVGIGLAQEEHREGEDHEHGAPDQGPSPGRKPLGGNGKPVAKALEAGVER
jgi:hypothetical protein